jgi:VIT1/CCC1 family predicted Fe2+/Mn2+ transporter
MLFALGAIVLILPFFVTAGRVAVIASVGLSGLGLFAIGAAITIFTGVTVLRSGIRQLALGLGAAGVTFVVGRIIGASLT